MKLLEPIDVGAFQLASRVVMAPLTRNRAKQPGDIPWALNAEYYRQRATAGMIITEATPISPLAKGYWATPGIWTNEQVDGWRRVTDAVHDEGGKIVLQLWHVGRISHVSLLPEGEVPVSSTNVRAESQTVLEGGERVDVSPPRALLTHEVPGVVEDFRAAAVNARAARFDGVEIHGANSYLLDQFVRDGVNRRTDRYGGSLENRLRFPLDVARAVCDVWGPGRVGYRISPAGEFNDLRDSDPITTFTSLARALGDLGIAYLHNVESFRVERREDQIDAIRRAFRDAGGGAYMANGAYSADTGEARILEDKADLVSFGELYIANPDLVERFRRGGPLNEPDRATYSGGDHRGYTDYPTLADLGARSEA